MDSQDVYSGHQCWVEADTQRTLLRPDTYEAISREPRGVRHAGVRTDAATPTTPRSGLPTFMRGRDKIAGHKGVVPKR